MMEHTRTGHGLDILLVEDDPDHVELVRHALEGQPTVGSIEHAADGVSALERLHDAGRQAALPDVILLDLKLPRRGGLEVLAEIKSDPDLQKIPVIILTTSAASTDVAKAYELHANSYLVKPIQYAKFAELVQTMSLYWGRVNRSPHV